MKRLPLAVLLVLGWATAAAAQDAAASLAQQALQHLGSQPPAPPATAAPAVPQDPQVPSTNPLADLALDSLKSDQDVMASVPTEEEPSAGALTAAPRPPRPSLVGAAIFLFLGVAVLLGLVTVARLVWTVPMRIFGLDTPAWIEACRPALTAWRWPFAALVVPLKWWGRQVRRRTDANAGWESAPGVLSRYGNYRPGQGIPFGAFVFAGFMWFETLAYRGALGVNVIGKPGSGKSALFIYWLATLANDASAFVIDIDGEITRVVGDELIRRGHQLCVIDMLGGLSGRKASSYNIFAEYAAIEAEQGRAAVIPAIKATGEALRVQQNELQKTFDERGRDFLVAVIALVYIWPRIPTKLKTLATVRALICKGLPTDPKKPKETPFEVLLFEMERMAQTDDGCGGLFSALIANGAVAIRSGNSRDGGNPFVGSAQAAVAAWDLPAVVGATTTSDFLMSDLKRGNTVVTVVCSPGDMRTTYQPLMRLLVTMLEYRFVTMARCRKTPAALIIDEVQNLGVLTICTTGPYMRKYEAQVALGIQDLPGLEAVYGKRAESMLSNAGMNCVLPTTDEKTIQYASRVLGMHTVKEKVEGTPVWLQLFLPRSMRVPRRYQNVERPLKNFEQLRDTLTPGRGRMVVLTEGRPFIAGVIKYWRVLPVSRYAASTYRETAARALTRERLDERRRNASTS